MKKTAAFSIIGVLVLVSMLVCTGNGQQGSQSVISSEAAVQEKNAVAPSNDIQIRIFADRGIDLPDGKKGGGVQIYGMTVQEDGSEQVVWKNFLWEFEGLKFNRGVDILYLNNDKVIICVYERETFHEFDRRTGTLLREGKSNDEYFGRFRKEYIWAYWAIIERPAITLQVSGDCE